MRTEIIIFPLPARPSPLPPKRACHSELNPQLLLHGDLTFPSWGPFLESADNIPGPKTSYVCLRTRKVTTPSEKQAQA